MTGAPLTAALAGFIAGLRADDLPAPVAARTLELVLDGSACLLAAANPAWSTGRLIAAFAKDQGGAPEASVVGQGFKTGAVHAALANGTMGYACDFEPHHPEAILHPIAVMIPAALAAGERALASGRAFLAAVALGCEVEYRVSMALGPAAQYALGFHPSAVCGGFGAAAAACHLLCLEAEAVTRALGLVACQASGLMAWESDPSENSPAVPDGHGGAQRAHRGPARGRGLRWPAGGLRPRPHGLQGLQPRPAPGALDPGSGRAVGTGSPSSRSSLILVLPSCTRRWMRCSSWSGTGTCRPPTWTRS